MGISCLDAYDSFMEKNKEKLSLLEVSILANYYENINKFLQLVNEDVVLEHHVEVFLREKLPVIYYARFNFSNVDDFVYSLNALSERELINYLNDDLFLHMILTAPDVGILSSFLDFVRDNNICLDNIPFFSNFQVGLLKSLGSLRDSINYSFNCVRANGDEILVKLDCLTKISSDFLKNNIFSAPVVLDTIRIGNESWLYGDIPMESRLVVIYRMLVTGLDVKKYIMKIVNRLAIYPSCFDDNLVRKL